jgi:hypothetical protein
MRALEFTSKIENNQIQIPAGIQSELKANRDKKIRVIVLMDEIENHDDLLFQKTAKNEFLKSYAESDSIYDK